MGKSKTEYTADDWAGAGRALTDWFSSQHRDLPWRRTHDPYAVLVAEIMLQQTQVKTVMGRYGGFLSRFPDAAALAAASEEELLKAWEGLGYYTRARNLQKAAREILEVYGGTVPQDAKTLQLLPGVGPYTAAAVAAIAFGKPEIAVDANAERIAARLDGCRQQVRTGSGRCRIESVLQQMQKGTDPGIFTQAIMELGQTVCMPRKACCAECPLPGWCRGKDAPCAYPARRPQGRRPVNRMTAVLLSCGERAGLMRRPDTGLLAGMYGPLLFEDHLRAEQAAAQVTALGSCPDAMRKIPGWKHEFTHRIWDLHGWIAEIQMPPDDEKLLWITREMLRETVAVPAAFRPVIQEWERTLWTES